MSTQIVIGLAVGAVVGIALLGLYLLLDVSVVVEDPTGAEEVEG